MKHNIIFTKMFSAFVNLLYLAGRTYKFVHIKQYV